MKGYILLLALLAATSVLCYCPPDKMHNLGQCSFRIQCHKDIKGVNLPDHCQGSSNYPVTVDLILTEAKDKIDEQFADTEFLTTITSFRASGNWPETKLSMLNYMPRLQHLILGNNKINHIIDDPFYHLNRLETIDLSHNNLTKIGELFQFETHPNKVRIVLLAYNAIDEIPGDAFGELASLKELDLSNNYIADLTEEPFYNLTMLETLKLTNNRIKDLNGAVNNLQNLRHLYLKGNQIQNIDVKSLKIIYDLETFDISSNQLDTMKPIVLSRHWQHFGSNSVCKIILSDNQITSIPNATNKELIERFSRSLRRKYFNNVDVLTEVDLSKNLIENVEYNALKPLVRLVSLDLSCNKIINFVVNPRDLEYMKYLNLSSNYITHLYYESFLSMNNLQNLDLSYNKLENIPEQSFAYNYNFKLINMTHNEIKSIHSLQVKMFHPQGGVLDLSNNGLTKLHVPFGEGSRLTMLLLHSNNITDTSVINLCHINGLEFLDMSNNLIEELDESSVLLPVTLTHLDFNYNFINKIEPGSFKRVGHLKTLRLARNQLTNIEYGAFQGLGSLQNLDLSFNKITYLDSKVMMDMKSLTVLSLRFNGLQVLEYKSWLGHKFDLKVFLEGNSFTCEWLGEALSDFNNGYSKMRPTVLSESITGHSLEGIPCIKKGNELGELARLSSATVMADERLLVITQKILEAVREQNYFMRKYIWGVNSEKENV